MTNRRGSRSNPITEAQRVKNRNKSKVRAKVEHAFHVMKRIFGFTMVRYRGLDKNANRSFATCALVNIYFKRRHLMRYATA
jgi:IS5 family transposase